MRVLLSVVALLACLVAAGLSHAAGQTVNTANAVLLETFEEYPRSTFPLQWKACADYDEAMRIYQVEEADGNRFLRARAGKTAIQIGLSHSFAPQRFSRLRWCWRVAQAPIGGDERRADRFDSAAGVYVLFDSKLVPRVIKYVWSATVPVGSRLQNPLYWRGKTVVLQSGSAATNTWQEETVDFYRDYKDLFGEEPGEALGIALLTSADSTKSGAEADYDDFVLLPPEK